MPTPQPHLTSSQLHRAPRLRCLQQARRSLASVHTRYLSESAIDHKQPQIPCELTSSTRSRVGTARSPAAPSPREPARRADSLPPAVSAVARVASAASLPHAPKEYAAPIRSASSPSRGAASTTAPSSAVSIAAFPCPVTSPLCQRQRLSQIAPASGATSAGQLDAGGEGADGSCRHEGAVGSCTLLWPHTICRRISIDQTQSSSCVCTDVKLHLNIGRNISSSSFGVPLCTISWNRKRSAKLPSHKIKCARSMPLVMCKCMSELDQPHATGGLREPTSWTMHTEPCEKSILAGNRPKMNPK